MADEHDHVVMTLTSASPYDVRFLEKGEQAAMFSLARLRLPRRFWESLGSPQEVTLTISAGDLLGDDEGLDYFPGM